MPGGGSVCLGYGGQAGSGLHPQGSGLARHGPSGARAVMAVLRAAHEPVNRELILSAGVAAAGDTTSSPDLAFRADAPAAVHSPLKALYALSPPPSSCSAATRGCWRTLWHEKSRRAMQCSSRSGTCRDRLLAALEPLERKRLWGRYRNYPVPPHRRLVR